MHVYVVAAPRLMLTCAAIARCARMCSKQIGQDEKGARGSYISAQACGLVREREEAFVSAITGTEEGDNKQLLTILTKYTKKHARM